MQHLKQLAILCIILLHARYVIAGHGLHNSTLTSVISSRNSGTTHDALRCSLSRDMGPASTLVPAWHQSPDLHKEITDTEALDCYKQYESEINGKSQEEMDTQLKNILRSHADIAEHRLKIIALLFAGATNQHLTGLVSMDDISLVSYAYKIQPIHMASYKHGSFGYPIIFDCKSIAMIELLAHHGVDIIQKNHRQENVLHKLITIDHYINDQAKALPSLLQFYCTLCPALLDEEECRGMTPLLCSIGNLVNRLTRLKINTSITYTLLNLGCTVDVRPTAGYYQGKTAYEIIIEAAQNIFVIKAKLKLLELAEYIKIIPTIRSSLFAKLCATMA